MFVEKVRLVSKDEVSLTESRPRLRGRCPERAEGVQKAGKKIYINPPIGPADHFPLLGGSNSKLDKNEPLVLKKCIGGLFLCKILNKLLLMRGEYHVHDEI